MQSEMQMRDLPSSATDNGTSVPEDPSKPELVFIPANALRAGTDDVHGMANGLPLTSDVNPTHPQVGVVTRRQSVTG